MLFKKTKNNKCNIKKITIDHDSGWDDLKKFIHLAFGNLPEPSELSDMDDNEECEE